MKFTSRLKRGAAIMGVSALVVGGAMLGGAQAHAAGNRLGNVAGAVHLTNASGTVLGHGTTTDTGLFYTTTQGCPSGNTGSAALDIIDNNGAKDTLSASSTPSTIAVSGAFTDAIPDGNLDSAINGVFNDLAGSTVEIVVVCFPQPSASGVGVFSQDSWLTFASTPNADGGYNWTETDTPPAGVVTPTITLSAGPGPFYTGANIPLTATVSASNGTPTGSVAFQLVGGGNILGGVAPNNNNPANLSNGQAAFTTNSFVTAQAYQLQAVFTTGDATQWKTTTSAPFTLTVATAPAYGGQLQLATSVPTNTTSFTITVDTKDVFNLTASGSTATNAPGGTTPNAVVVSDQRNTFPGWSVSGQANPWTGTAGTTAAGGSIPADNLGFTPSVSGGSGGDVDGTGVAPGANLGDTAAVWAYAPSGYNGGSNGFGTSNLNAVFTLNLPPAAPAGPYTTTFSVTGVNSHA